MEHVPMQGHEVLFISRSSLQPLYIKCLMNDVYQSKGKLHITEMDWWYPSPITCSPTHPLPLLGPGVTLYWGIKSLRVQCASLSSDGLLGHLLIHMQLWSRALGYWLVHNVVAPTGLQISLAPWLLSLAPPLGTLWSIQ